jgi:3' terminal RNA ribose 2'-O-methyltransferase Hen1
MQVEITLEAPRDAAYSARDLGFLLGKHPDRLFERKISVGKTLVFYTSSTSRKAAALLYLDVDPIAMVRGPNRQAAGLLSNYVNDRPYVANSLLSVAIARAYNQAMAGKSKDRQSLADQSLPFKARVTPISVAGRPGLVQALFAPLGYEATATPLLEDGPACLFDVEIAGEVRLRDLLRHLYMLIPVLDNRKHYWVGEEEVDKLLSKGEGWLADHPAKNLIASRALRYERNLTSMALARLAEAGSGEAGESDSTRRRKAEQALEKPIRLHHLRLDCVVSVLREHGAASILDLGCGEGKLILRLTAEPWARRIVGVDASVAMVKRAAKRLRHGRAAAHSAERVSVRLGSLTYGDRRWSGFDAATLVEVIEHLDPARLPALERSLFGGARPGLVVMTTPNREYNVLLDGLKPGALRHADHRFEWTREEFMEWAESIVTKWGYSVELRGIGPEKDHVGSPSQMAVFKRETAVKVAG